MAGELVGGALLSGLISKLFDRMAPQDVIMKFFRGKADVVKLLEELKVNLRSADLLLSDAEEKQLTDRYVKMWLDEVTDVIYRADFLMDKIDTEVSRRQRDDESATIARKFLNFVSTSVVAFEKAVIVEVKEILEKLCFLLAQTVSLGLKDRVPTRSMKWSGEFERSVIDEGNQIRERIKRLLKQASLLRLNKGVPNRPLRRLTAPFVGKESDVVGRDGDKEQIIELLLSDDAGGRNLSVIPIVGLGGIGKTTLAQLVYKDSRVRKHFNSKAWVTVSEAFDVSQITKRIYKEATSQECQTDDVFVLQSKLNEALAGKMFLLVLDDVWNENYVQWDSLKSAFESGARGSKIIVTTRSKYVALTMSMGVMHELKLVSDQDCWRIFEKLVFEDSAEAPAQLQEIGRKIVKRCKGLPLAVKLIAGLLRSTNSKPEEWRKILDSDIWQLQFQENLKNYIVPALWLSYHFLPPCFKRCFAYCSIFPKDYKFGESDMKKIIWLWMAEGLLEAENGKRAEEVGEEYLQALIGRSFFQYSSQHESELIMHDIVHDLAMFLSGEFCFELNDSNDLSNLPTKPCHLSISTKGPELSEIMKGLTSQTRSLRAFLLLPQSYPRPIIEKSLLHDLFLKVGGCLRVLSLSPSSITELPDSIGNMKYLRYLDLSRTSINESPDSICTLYNLQTLLLSNCRDLKRLPTGLAALVNLRHLDIEGSSRIKEMPPQMYKMRSLEILSDFVLGENDSWRIKELGELPLLGGRLHISGLEHIVDVEDVLEANLKDKKFLSHLILEWDCVSNITSSYQEREVLEALQPHTNLQQLTIRGYRGTIFPDWVGHESFCNMVEVKLWDCRNVRMLPPLGQLSSLRRLVIWFLDGVFSIGNEFCGSPSTTNNPFTSLEYLDICYMPSWEKWSFSSDQLIQEGGVFPSLTELYMDGCKKLNLGLPDCYLPNLKSISIENCDEMVGVVCQSRQKMDTNVFPSLESMSLLHCPRLECFPQEGLPPSLSCLRIDGCPLLEQRCQKGIGDDWPKIQHIPKIDIWFQYLVILITTGMMLEAEVLLFIKSNSKQLAYVTIKSFLPICCPFTSPAVKLFYISGWIISFLFFKPLILLTPFNKSFKIESKRSLVCYQDIAWRMELQHLKQEQSLIHYFRY